MKINCTSCSQLFEGRRHAKTCSARCRKRLQRIKQTTSKLADEVKIEVRRVEKSLEKSAHELSVNQAGFVAFDTATDEISNQNTSPVLADPESLEYEVTPIQTTIQKPQPVESQPQPQILSLTPPEQTLDAFDLSQPNYTLDSSLEVREPFQVDAPRQPETTSPNVFPRRNSPFSRRRAVIVSAVITGIVITILGSGLLIAGRRSAVFDKTRKNLPTASDVSLKGATLSDLPAILQTDTRSLYVNGDIIGNSELKITNGTNTSSITLGVIDADQELTLPNDSGTFCLDSNNCNFITQDQLTAGLQDVRNNIPPATVIPPQEPVELGTDTTGNYVAEITGNSQVSVSGSGSPSASVLLGLVSDSIGDAQLAFNTGQNLTVISSPTFGGLAINGDASLSSSGTLFVNNIVQTASGNNLIVSASADALSFISGGRTFILPTNGPGSQTICTTGVSCAAGGGQAVLLAPGSAQTDPSADASIFINDTGGGNLLQLQSGGVDRFVVANNGDINTSGLLNVNGTGVSIINDQLFVGDQLHIGPTYDFFYLDNSGGTPIIAFDANDFIGYDRTNDRLHTNIGGSIISSLTSTGLGLGDASPAYLLTVGSGDLFGVNSSGNVIVTALGTAGSTSVCRNGSNQLATCSGAGGSDPSATLQNAYDNSTSPATITTSSDTKTVLIKAGVGADADKMFQVQDSGGNNILEVDTANQQVGIGNVGSPATAVLHVVGYNQASANSPANSVLKVTGGKGGVASGGIGGTGGLINLTAGAGGDATGGGNTAGNGGNISIQGGAAGMATSGATAGSYGNLLLQTSGGNVGIGDSNPSSKLTVRAITDSAALLVLKNSDGTSGLEVRPGGSGKTNSFIGISAGASNTAGNYNTVFGYQAFENNTTGSINTAVGNEALKNNTSGNSNTAIGQQALYSNNTGGFNSALGNAALFSNTTGANNTGIGDNALFFNTTGNSNSALGAYSLTSNTTGSYNIGLGDCALCSNTTGSGNTALGQWAGDLNTTGSNNTSIGARAGDVDPAVPQFVSGASLQNATMIGYGAQSQISNSLILGGQVANQVNVGIGTTSPTNVLSVSPYQYFDNATTASQTGTTVTGVGTTFTSSMVGSEIVWADGSKATITAFGSTTSLTVTPSQTISSQKFRIHYAALQITSGGNVGIGTTNPDNVLKVVSPTAATPGSEATYVGKFEQGGVAGFGLGGDANYWYLQSFQSKPLQINGSGNNTIINATAGNVGIADTTPAYTLTVGNGDLFGVQGADGSLIWEGTSADANETVLTVVNPTADITYRLADATAGTYDLCSSAGNCLTGGGAATLQSAYNAGNTITGTTGRNISITLADLATDQTLEINQAGTADVLRVNDDGTFSDTTPFVIDQSGNVGIGIPSPSVKLHVYGTTGEVFRVRTDNATFGISNYDGDVTTTDDIVINGGLRLQGSTRTVASEGADTGVRIQGRLNNGVAGGSVAVTIDNNATITNTDKLLSIQNNGSEKISFDKDGNYLANGTTTGTGGTTTGTGTNTTTLTLTTDALNVNDIVLIDNAGQDYYTRITVDPGTGSYTVSPAVTFETGRTVTKYNTQNIGATATDYTTRANRLFQGYFLGGVVTGAGSTTLSDQNLTSTGNLSVQSDVSSSLLLNPAGGKIGIGTVTPNGLLHVSSAVTDIPAFLVDTTVTGTALAQIGANISPTFNPSGNINAAIGSYTSAQIDGASNVSSLIGQSIGVSTLASYSGVVAQAIGISISDPTFSGSVPASTKGLQVSNQGVAGVTDSYGLYVDPQSGATNSYAAVFAGGNVGIGDITPSSRLEVGDGTDSLQISSVGDLLFVDADGGSSITGPNGGALNIAAANSQALNLSTTTGGNINLTTAVAAGLVNILTGNLKVGAGTPTISLNGDDAYITGALEVDGILYAHGNSIQSSTAEALSLSADDVSVVGCLNVGSATECSTQGNVQLSGDLNLNGGDISTTQTISFLFNTTVTTIHFGGQATDINMGIAGGSAGTFDIHGGSGDTGCTFQGSDGSLVCSGNITGAATGTQGYWARTGTTLSPATSNDVLSISTNAATGGALSLTSSAITTSGSSGLNNTVTITGTGAAATYYGQKLSVTNNQTTNANTLYGQHINFTDAGTVANTVTGLYVDAATANTADTSYAAVFQGGNVGIGTASPSVGLHVKSASGLLVEGGATGTGTLVVETNGNAATDFSNIALRRTRGTFSSPTANLADDALGVIQASGWDTGYTAIDAIKFVVPTGMNWGDGGDASDAPIDILFSTSTDGNQSSTERMRILSSGNVGIGTGTPTTGRLVVVPSSDSSAIVSTGYSVTGSGGSSLIDLTGTWNTSGTPTGIKLDITNTASNANSRLLWLLEGTSARFTVQANGATEIASTSTTGETTNLGNSTSAALTIQQGSTTANNFAALRFSDNDGVGANIAAKFVDHTNNYADLLLNTRAADGFQTRLTVLSAGNVGIGDTSPDALLDVGGNIQLDGNLLPSAASTTDLGSATVEIDELFVGDDNGIKLGLDQDATFAYDETTDDRVELTGTGASLFIEDRLSLGRTDMTIADNGVPTSSPTQTLEPASSYVEVTCNDLDGCTVSMSEAASVKEGNIVIIVNVGTNNVTMQQNTNVSMWAGGAALVLGPNDTATAIYIGDRWVQMAASNN